MDPINPSWITPSVKKVNKLLAFLMYELYNKCLLRVIFGNPWFKLSAINFKLYTNSGSIILEDDSPKYFCTIQLF